MGSRTLRSFKVKKALLMTLVILIPIAGCITFFGVPEPRNETSNPPVTEEHTYKSQTYQLAQVPANGSVSFDDQVRVDFGLTQNNMSLQQDLDYYDGVGEMFDSTNPSPTVQTRAIALYDLASQGGPAKNEMDMDVARNHTRILLDSQKVDGSWNEDVADTALASYALQRADDGKLRFYDDRGALPLGVIDRGQDTSVNRSISSSVGYLTAKEVNGSWGDAKDTALAVLALEKAGKAVRTDGLLREQGYYGSFGNGDVEATAWAVMALSARDEYYSLYAAGKAVMWLDYQDIQDPGLLGIVAAAEGTYRNAYMSHQRNDTVFSKLIGPPSVTDRPAPPLSGGAGAPAKALSCAGVSFRPLGGFLLLVTLMLAAVGLFANLRTEERILGGIRGRILEYIQDKPGVHQADIKKEFHLSPSSVMHHLAVLESTEYIASETHGKYKRYFTNGRTPMSPEHRPRMTPPVRYSDRSVVSILRNSNTMRIVLFLIKHPEASQKDIASNLGMHPSTVSWHTERLSNVKLLKLRREGRNVRYRLNETFGIMNIYSIILSIIPLYRA